MEEISSELRQQFIRSEDNLWVYKEARLIFHSRKKWLTPLLEYIDTFVPQTREVTIFDRIVGNAAALLLKKASCLNVYSPLASQIAARSLEESGISYHFDQIVPHILNQEGNNPCPMEKLSLGKTPEEFYREIISTRR